MKEIRDIVAAVERSSSKGGILATVVEASGSTYRRPGARMLVLDDGMTVGSISGGCLEADVIEHGRRLNRDQCISVTYDTRSDADIVWGLGLGCNGAVTILIERVDAGSIDWMVQAIAGRQRVVCARVFAVDGPMQELLGSHLVVTDDAFEGDAMLMSLVTESARTVLASGVLKVERFLLEDSELSVFIESIEPALKLVIFGGGHDAVPLVRQAALLGWDITVVDQRPAFATRERFPEAAAVLCARPEEACTLVDVDERTAIVLMTHSYLQDRDLLSVIHSSDAFYLGVLGPRRRTLRLVEELSDRCSIEPIRLWYPIGLDIGAETPEEIALAIVAEIQAVRAGRSAGFLRDRSGTIHDRTGIVVLAAGGSTRLGRPKQQLEFRGRSLLRRAAETALESDSGPVVVVLGAHADALRLELDGLNVKIVENQEWRDGMGSSISRGVGHLMDTAPSVTSILLMVCDQPFVTTEVLRDLNSRRAVTHAPIVASAYGDTLGVPALFDVALAGELMRLPSEHGAKDLIASYGADVESVHVPRMDHDVDTVEDYARLLTSEF